VLGCSAIFGPKWTCFDFSFEKAGQNKIWRIPKKKGLKSGMLKILSRTTSKKWDCPTDQLKEIPHFCQKSIVSLVSKEMLFGSLFLWHTGFLLLFKNIIIITIMVHSFIKIVIKISFHWSIWLISRVVRETNLHHQNFS
jgi:hypothetical protein